MSARVLPDGRTPVLLSAHAEALIGHDAAAILRYLDRRESHGHHTGDGTVTPASVAATVLGTRRIRRHRAVVRARDTAELRAGLQALTDGAAHPLVARSATAAPLCAFIFPGQGGQWPGMGADAYDLLPEYREEVQRCDAAFTRAGHPSPRSHLLGEPGHPADQIHIQGSQFVHAAALARVWRSFDVMPDCTVGHSLGEIAAGYVAGAISLPDAVAVVAARATVLGGLPGRYGMAVLGADLRQAQHLATETPGWLEVAVVNAPSSTVLSGDAEAIRAVVRRAERSGLFVRELAVDFPAHTSALEPLRPTLAELLPDSAFSDSPVAFIGSATGTVVPDDAEFVDYWYANLRNTVRFDRAVGAALHRGVGAFVELSAHPSTQYALTELVGDDDDPIIVGSGRRDAEFGDELAGSIVSVALGNPDYRWARFAPPGDHRPLPEFPHAPMQTVHLWAEPDPLPGDTPDDAVILTASEQWVHRPDTGGDGDTADTTTVAIVAADPTGDALAGRLRAAAAADPGCRRGQLPDAETVVVVAPALADEAAESTQTDPRGVALDYRKYTDSCARRIWLVTVGGERVRSDDPPPVPVQAGLAASHRCVAFEYPHQQFGHLDLAVADIDADTAAACLAVLRGDTAEAAVRPGDSGPEHYRRTLSEDSHAPPALSSTEFDQVVITGGNGSLGRRFARYCIERGARRVVLLSRGGLDPSTLNELADGFPVEISAPTCDITDTARLQTIAAEHGGSEAASLLIHAAGVGRFAGHHQLTPADWSTVCGAKVNGLTSMIDHWPLRPEARVIACSSISGVWGGQGHAAYAAANRMLDATIEYLRARGRRATAVRFGLWQNTGVADPDEIARIERAGFVAMDPGQALQAGLRAHSGDPLVFAADPDRFRVFIENQGPAAALGTTPSERGDQQPLTELVPAALAGVLSLPDPGTVDLGVPLIDLGIDSLLALDLRKRLRRGAGSTVALARLLGGITGAELIAALQTAAPASTAGLTQPQRWESVRD
ncbi:mycobactin polyketide synthase MbtD [Mycolicibacillus parakoreensis]|uniref:Mycobactin polyketide synthase MbtD n=1 Tax=Mycolicibacillus parakoreensis TaxID=1069221 RepID=A0ABY3U1R1_9MYCO|nr:mycobactin polyketide synthase MbtD [Mycolicibacillus parakoreensis]MCV7314895.1 mycobactin polyketide synthase MbtD [Mycolicibacillus parakoreensis]ULN53889.1 mycobactin polyketide synthase MbtD [Mycolicibacillus parakoreensis]